MGWLVKAPEPVDMRLPSLGGGLPAAEERRMQQDEALMLRRERMRRNVQNARVAYLGEVGQTAKNVCLGMRYGVEQSARYAPDALPGLDMLAATVEMGCAQLLGEMAR